MPTPAPLSFKHAFFEELEKYGMPLPKTLKAMRKIAGMTQTEYAEFVGVAPRIIIDIERGIGNPTLKSLNKIAKPFGLSLGFRQQAWKEKLA